MFQTNVKLQPSFLLLCLASTSCSGEGTVLPPERIDQTFVAEFGEREIEAAMRVPGCDFAKDSLEQAAFLVPPALEDEPGVVNSVRYSSLLICDSKRDPGSSLSRVDSSVESYTVDIGTFSLGTISEYFWVFLYLDGRGITEEVFGQRNLARLSSLDSGSPLNHISFVLDGLAARTQTVSAVFVPALDGDMRDLRERVAREGFAAYTTASNSMDDAFDPQYVQGDPSRFDGASDGTHYIPVDVAAGKIDVTSRHFDAVQELNLLFFDPQKGSEIGIDCGQGQDRMVSILLSSAQASRVKCYFEPVSELETAFVLSARDFFLKLEDGAYSGNFLGGLEVLTMRSDGR